MAACRLDSERGLAGGVRLPSDAVIILLLPRFYPIGRRGGCLAHQPGLHSCKMAIMQPCRQTLAVPDLALAR